MKRIFTVLIALVCSINFYAQEVQKDGKTYEEEGECPKCKMALKKVEKEGDGHDNDEGHNSDSDHGDEH